MSIALEFCNDPLIRKAAQMFHVEPLATLETSSGFVPVKVSAALPEKPKPKTRKKGKAIDLTGELFE